MAELNVRKLQTQDLFAVARIISGCTSAARDAMKGAVHVDDDGEDEPGENTKQVHIDTQALGFAIFEAAIDQETEIKKLFANIGGLSVKQLDESEYDTVVVILEKVVEENDLAGFFERAMGLASKVSGGSSI